MTRVSLMDESTATLPADLQSETEPEAAPEWVTVEKRAAEPAPLLPDAGLSKLIALLITGVTLAFAAGFTWVNLHPRLLLSNTTPAGGDMGAHVWGPAYLRDHLLPDFRLTGWTKDWYSGFPAYQYYMVLPALMIVALDLVLPYAIAFKLISVAGLVAMPFCAASMARNFGMRFPGPGILGVMMLPFLWDTTWTIYGGNVASTMAGEFSFTLSLCFALLFLGVLAKGLETGRHRVRAAVLFALVALCHPLPLLGLVFIGIVAVALWQIGALISSPKPTTGGPGRLRALGTSLWWGISALGIGSALTAFWIVPFIGKGDYLNDMGWTKLATTSEKALFYLFHLGSEDGTKPLLNPSCADASSICNLSMQFWLVAVVLAIVGAVLAVVLRDKLGIVLIMIAAGTSAAFMLMPQHRFWNARVLPFWYLSVYLLAGVGLTLLVSWVRSVIPRATVLVAFAVVATFVVGLGLRIPPSKQVGGRNEISLGVFTIGDRSNFTQSWARWNYEGYEGKPSYPEYKAVVNEMDRIGQTNGCGRAMWEYDNDRLNKYGTPMALMLLPHWTNGCIGSMEGLFFESSPTTPFHFLNQSELSARPSRPQSGLPYRETDVTQGVKHLQLLGVRYYMAFSESLVTAARANPDLVEISQVGGDEVMVNAEREAAAPSPGPHRPGAAVGGLRGERCRTGRAVELPSHRARGRRRRPARMVGARRGVLQRPHPLGRTSRIGRPRCLAGVDHWRAAAQGGGDAHQGHQDPRGERADLVHRGHGRKPGPGQDLVLSQLEGEGRTRALPGHAQPDGRGSHREPGRALLRVHRNRCGRLCAVRRRAVGFGGHGHASPTAADPA